MVDHPPGVVDDLLHAQVHVGAEPSVEGDLAAEDPLAPLRGAEVDERQPDVLLALVHQIAVEHERGDVGLDHVDRRRGGVEVGGGDAVHRYVVSESVVHAPMLSRVSGRVLAGTRPA